MADLIERGALVGAIGNGAHDTRSLIRIVYAQPTVAAAQVVRCKDCMLRSSYDCPLEYAIEWGIGNTSPSDDDYCSEAIRMDADAPERAEGGGV